MKAKMFGDTFSILRSGQRSDKKMKAWNRVPTHGAAVLILILVMVIGLGTISPKAFAYKIPTHDWIFEQAERVLRNDGKTNQADFVKASLDQLKTGSREADEGQYGAQTAYHYHHPDLKVGLFGNPVSAANVCAAIYSGVAKEHWNKGNFASAMKALGAAAHLVQDLTVPHHAWLDMVSYHSAYEDWVNKNKDRYGVDSRYVNVKVQNAKNVPEEDVGSKSDPYVKVYIKEGKDFDKRFIGRTEAKSNTAFPKWYSTISTCSTAGTIKIRFEIFDEDDASSDDYIGGKDSKIYDTREIGAILDEELKIDKATLYYSISITAPADPRGKYDNSKSPYNWVHENAKISYNYMAYVNGENGSRDNDYNKAAIDLLALSIETTAGFISKFLSDVGVAGAPSKNAILVHRPEMPIKLDSRMLTQDIPLQSQLLQNYPNPFNPETWIPYALAMDTDVVIKIYDVSGKLVETLNLGRKEAGYYLDKDSAAYWDGKNANGEQVGSGVFFYTIKAGSFSATRKLLVVK